MIIALCVRWIAPYVAGAAALLAALGAILLTGRRQGRQAEQRRTMGREIEIRETRDAVDRAVVREPDVVGKLRERWTRD